MKTRGLSRLTVSEFKAWLLRHLHFTRFQPMGTSISHGLIQSSLDSQVVKSLQLIVISSWLQTSTHGAKLFHKWELVLRDPTFWAPSFTRKALSLSYSQSQLWGIIETWRSFLTTTQSPPACPFFPKQCLGSITAVILFLFILLPTLLFC